MTEFTPKPLIDAGSGPMIEGIIESLHQNGIYEIYVVVGYLCEQFEYLSEKYQALKLLKNPDYAKHNNISSLYTARAHLEDAIILDGDLIIKNPDILHPEFEHSGYVSLWTEHVENEWLQTVDETGFVVDCSRTGGKDGWQLFSISFWTPEDARQLKRHVEELYSQHTDKFWDDIPMFLKKDEYRLKVRPIMATDVIEIDTLKDLEGIE